MSGRVWRRPATEDVTGALGFQSPIAYALGAVILTLYTVLGLSAGGVHSPAYFIAAMAVLFLAFCLLLAAPDDPMAIGWAVAVVLLVALAPFVEVPGLDAHPAMAHAVLADAIAIIVAFVVVRGRVWIGWIGYALVIAAAVTTDRMHGTDADLTEAVILDLPVLVMATAFAAIVRPRAARIYLLRRRTADQAAVEASEQAALAVRDRQLALLGDQVRPTLERIAAGGELDQREVTDCRLLEAALRDRIRARGLDSSPISAAARGARARGARVVLLDDRPRPESAALGAVPTDFRAAAIEALESAGSGDTVTVRLLPPGRGTFATIAGPHGPARSFDDDGAPAD